MDAWDEVDVEAEAGAENRDRERQARVAKVQDT
jgi:hypothetical protein